MKKPIYKALLCRAPLHIDRYIPGQAGVKGRAFILSKMLIGILSEKQDDRDFLFSSLDLYFLGDLQLAFVLSKVKERSLALQMYIRGCHPHRQAHRPGSRSSGFSLPGSSGWQVQAALRTERTRRTRAQRVPSSSVLSRSPLP